MPERMSPERLEEIIKIYTARYRYAPLDFGLFKVIPELIAEIRTSWDDVAGLTGEIKNESGG